MKTISKILLLQLLALSLPAQDEVIKPSDAGMSLFDDSGVKHIRIVSSDSETLLIEVECETEDEKTYMFYGELLDSRKKKMTAFSCTPQELSKGSETVDLEFSVSKKNSSSKTNLKSGYIRIKMTEKDEDSLMGDIEGLFGGGGDDPVGDLFAKKVTFKYEKDWRLKGNKTMIINVALTPVGDAKNLK